MASIKMEKFNATSGGYESIKDTQVDADDFLLVYKFLKEAKPSVGFYKITLTTDNRVGSDFFTPHPDPLDYIKVMNYGKD